MSADTRTDPPTPSRKAADELLDAVEEAIAERALPVTVQNRLKAAFNEVVDQANKTALAKHGLVFENSDAGRLADLRDAVEIMDQKITPYGERDEDGTTLAYIVGDSTWHRALAVARGSTSDAARKAIDGYRREALIAALPGAFQLADQLGWDSDDFTDRETLEAVADRLLGKDQR